MAEPLLVRDLMTVGVTTCVLDTPVVEAAQLLLDKDLEAVVVLDQEGHAVGMVTQEDLVRAYVHGDYQGQTAGMVMREGIPTVPPDIPAAAAIQIMQDQGVRVLFLVHHAEGIFYPAAVLSYKHVLRSLVALDSAEDLGIKAKRVPPLEAFIKRRDAARRQARSPHEE
jgi:CBS domain-containing protein